MENHDIITKETFNKFIEYLMNSVGWGILIDKVEKNSENIPLNLISIQSNCPYHELDKVYIYKKFNIRTWSRTFSYTELDLQAHGVTSYDEIDPVSSFSIVITEK